MSKSPSEYSLSAIIELKAKFISQGLAEALERSKLFSITVMLRALRAPAARFKESTTSPVLV